MINNGFGMTHCKACKGWINSLQQFFEQLNSIGRPLPIVSPDYQFQFHHVPILKKNTKTKTL